MKEAGIFLPIWNDWVLRRSGTLWIGSPKGMPIGRKICHPWSIGSLANRGRSGLLRGSMIIGRGTEPFSVPTADRSCFPPVTSSIRALAGHLFGRSSLNPILRKRKIDCYWWSEPRFCVLVVVLTWGTYSKTVRNRRDCAIVSIRLHSTSKSDRNYSPLGRYLAPAASSLLAAYSMYASVTPRCRTQISRGRILRPRHPLGCSSLGSVPLPPSRLVAVTRSMTRVGYKVLSS